MSDESGAWGDRGFREREKERAMKHFQVADEKPEVLLVDPRDCGAGEGDNCCAYLVAGREGLQCGRVYPSLVTQIQARLAAGTMNAKYAPTVPHPQCQTERPR